MKEDAIDDAEDDRRSTVGGRNGSFCAKRGCSKGVIYFSVHRLALELWVK